VIDESASQLWRPMPIRADPDALNAWLEQRRIALCEQIPHGFLPEAIADVWAGGSRGSCFRLCF
jgi:hypothetical protein